MFISILKSLVHDGSLGVIDAGGRLHKVGDGSAPSATIRLMSKAMEYRLAVNPALTVGEAYMNGALRIEEGTLYDFAAVIGRNASQARSLPWLALLNRARRHVRQSNPMSRARRNVAHHYDLSNEFYAMFLDRDMQYSCAYFHSPDDDLETAQANKKRHIMAKLLLDRRGLRVLDIGSGWGGMCLDIATHCDAEVTGVTLSTEQYRLSVERAAAAGVAERVGFHLEDYRDEAGPYDRIVSVGMFEHVGKRNYAEFFAKLRDLLTDDGVALIHTIGYSDHPAPINPFLRKYIFPGADLPSLSEIAAAVEWSGLIITDVEVLRLHYAETLRHWRERFVARRADVVRLYDERFYRMWEFYLVLCEIGFRMRTNVVFQIQLTKRLDALPIRRDYMVD
ncbi:cyclopropane-fatty-acyl-phospholipid synthase (plasmid) [Acidiphilium cryptum JF-5]|uniref:Cyclopropane-fatty-acyl-phospholipid synthase n=2 Tax=Acidiphilium cryptum TaxID=524 RepID=A5FT37_ACICJ|nr:cyclopropane-fatty-acyl-phospholipid synthase [Acidiphilium cryptum JF-5]